MKQEEIILELDNIKESFTLYDGLQLLEKYEGGYSKILFDSIEKKVIQSLLDELSNYDEQAQKNKLEKWLTLHDSEVDSLDEEFASEKHELFYDILKENTISKIKNIITQLSLGQNFLERSRIEIKTDITLFLAFIKAMKDEFALNPDKITNYRISQLVSDNFSDKDGKPIDLSYCNTKFSTGKGVLIYGNEKLQTSIESILKKVK